MGFVDEQDDRFRRGFDFVDHAFETPLEFTFDAGAGLQQAHVQRQQLDALEHLRHFTGSDARGQAFDDGGFTDAGLTDHDRVVFAATGKDVDHLPDRAIAAQHRVEFAVAGLLGQVVREALQQRFALRRRLAVGGWLLLLRQGEFLQAIDVQFGEQRLVTAAGVAHRVTQQREDQRGVFHRGLAQFEVGHQQRVLQPLHQFRGEHRVARGAVFNARLQCGAQFTGIDVGILQRSREQAIRTLQQTQQQVFDEDLAAATGHATFGRTLQIATGFGVQRLDELLQVYVDHGSRP